MYRSERDFPSSKARPRISGPTSPGAGASVRSEITDPKTRSLLGVLGLPRPSALRAEPHSAEVLCHRTVRIEGARTNRARPEPRSSPPMNAPVSRTIPAAASTLAAAPRWRRETGHERSGRSRDGPVECRREIGRPAEQGRSSPPGGTPDERPGTTAGHLRNGHRRSG